MLRSGKRNKLSQNEFKKLPYQRPVAKTANINSFFLAGICNDHTDGSGRAKTAKSERQLNKPVAFQIASTSKQRPSSQGAQAFSRGLQAKMAENSRAEYMIRLIHIQI